MVELVMEFGSWSAGDGTKAVVGGIDFDFLIIRLWWER